jgi:hypothetical protein
MLPDSRVASKRSGTAGGSAGMRSGSITEARTKWQTAPVAIFNFQILTHG